jgi:divalent metal cation (Fe/Co/Zn/Cd) transporter
VKKLTGVRPSTNVINKILNNASNFNIAGVNDITAWHSGNSVHAKIKVNINPNMSIEEACKIAEEIESNIESVDDVEVCSISITIDTQHTKLAEIETS